MSGLREALAKLADQWADQPNDYDEDTEQQIADGRALRELLAAHPAEPAPVASRYRLAWLSARRRASIAAKAFYAEASAARELESAVAEMQPAPVANRERVAEVLQRTIHMLDSNPKQWNELDPIEQVAYRDEAESLAIALFTSDVFRDEAEAIEEAYNRGRHDGQGDVAASVREIGGLS